MATTNKDTKVVTGKVRLSYCNLFQPRAVEEGQEAKYSCTILVPKSDKVTAGKIKAAIEAAKALIEHGADIDREGNGWTPEQVARCYGHPEIVELISRTRKLR
jgi:hypothetical protein